MPVVKVFLSSVMKGMETLRQTVVRAIEGLSMVALRFEAFPARPSSPSTISFEEIRNADIFIQIIGSEISDIVEKEYEAALEFAPDRILVFVQDTELSADARKHFDRVKKSYTYKKFRTAEDLEKEVGYAINSLVAATLASKQRVREGRIEEVLAEESASLSVGGSATWPFELERGDTVKGLLTGTDTFHVYFLTQRDYADYLNDNDSIKADARIVRAYAIDRQIRYPDTYYLVAFCCAWLGTRVELRLKKIREVDVPPAPRSKSKNDIQLG